MRRRRKGHYIADGCIPGATGGNQLNQKQGKAPAVTCVD